MSMPRAFGPALGSAAFRQRPEDFEVEELIDFAADGDGPHQLLRVRKIGANTVYVAGLLARYAGVAERDVGFSGLKDRHALAIQYFSVPTPAAGIDWSSFVADGVQILQATPHRRKLRRGAHCGNRFSLLLSGIEAPAEAVDQRLQRIALDGFPNSFGEQRFGRGNRDSAQMLLRGGGRQLNRNQRSFALSALRSELFNEILGLRVADGSWNRALPGEPLLLDGRGSWFIPEQIDAEIEARLARGEIHASGALVGLPGKQTLGGPVAELEHEVLARYPGIESVFQRFNLEADRRALRCLPRQLRWHWPEPGQLRLDFELVRGSFATSLLQEIFDAEDAAKSRGEG
jgi:tRNA pseudouridine13 synthase